MIQLFCRAWALFGTFGTALLHSIYIILCLTHLCTGILSIFCLIFRCLWKFWYLHLPKCVASVRMAMRVHPSPPICCRCNSGMYRVTWNTFCTQSRNGHLLVKRCLQQMAKPHVGLCFVLFIYLFLFRVFFSEIAMSVSIFIKFCRLSSFLSVFHCCFRTFVSERCICCEHCAAHGRALAAEARLLQ